MKSLWLATIIAAATLSLSNAAQAAPGAPDGLVPPEVGLFQDVKQGWGRGHPGRGWGVGGRPPGWHYGGKRGWRGQGMPPGQYRKRYRGNYYYGGPVLYAPRYW